jgi:hypothetical protein
MGRKIPEKYLRSKQVVRKLFRFGCGPGISPPNPKKT